MNFSRMHKGAHIVYKKYIYQVKRYLLKYLENMLWKIVIQKETFEIKLHSKLNELRVIFFDRIDNFKIDGGIIMNTLYISWLPGVILGK